MRPTAPESPARSMSWSSSPGHSSAKALQMQNEPLVCQKVVTTDEVIDRSQLDICRDAGHTARPNQVRQSAVLQGGVSDAHACVILKQCEP